MGQYSKFKSVEALDVDIDGDLITIFKTNREMFDNGACQCFSDCDCYENNGKSLGIYSTYSHPLITSNYQRPKQYFNLNTCIQSFRGKLKDILEHYNK